MRFHGVQAQVEAVGDVFVAVPLGQQLINLPFTLGERIERIFRLLWVPLETREPVSKNFRYARAEICAPFSDGMNRANQLVTRRILTEDEYSKVQDRVVVNR